MKKVKWLILAISIIMIVGDASAIEEILDSFNIKYNTSGSRLDTCDTCHDRSQKNKCELCDISNLNSYGKNLRFNLNIDISKAFAKIETIDSDKDGFTNVDEIKNLRFPGNKNDSLSIRKTKSTEKNIIWSKLLQLWKVIFRN